MMSMFSRCSAVILVIILNLQSYGQVVFQKTYGGNGMDFSRTVQQTLDGGYIMAESTESFGSGSRDLYLVKADEEGNLEWAHAYGGTSWDAGNAAQQTTDGGYILCGNTSNFGAGANDILLIKTDGLGNEIWSKTYGGSNTEVGYFVVQTTDGGYLVAGRTESFGAGASDFYAIKTDSNGDTIWTKTYGGGGWEECMSVQETNDGGFVLVGYTKSYGEGQEDIYLVKTNINGNIEWTKVYGGTQVDFPYSVRQTFDGGYIICARTKSFGAGLGDVYIIKTDPQGDTLWTKVYGGSMDEWGFDIQQARDGGFLIVGNTESFGGGKDDVYAIKIDNTGNILWTKAYGGAEMDQALAVDTTSDGGFVISGRTFSFGAGSYDIYLIKIDSEGNSGSCNEFSTGTIVGNTATKVTSGSFENSGGTVSSPPGLLTTTSTVESTLCFDTIVVAVNDQRNDYLHEINVYPNPTNGVITVENALSEDFAISVRNNLGKELMNLNIQEGAADARVFDLSKYPDGIYFVRIQLSDQIFNKKIVVVR